MALKFKYKAKEEIPAEHAGFFAERDGAWHLDVEGAVEKTKLEEFRASGSRGSTRMRCGSWPRKNGGWRRRRS